MDKKPIDDGPIDDGPIDDGPIDDKPIYDGPIDDKPIYEFTVNQTSIKTPHEKLSAADIIRLAIKHGAVSGKPEGYVLESLEPEREFKPDDIVNLLEYKEFVTEKSGPTPVAGTRS